MRVPESSVVMLVVKRERMMRTMQGPMKFMLQFNCRRWFKADCELRIGK
jgi:hypothetical protein